MPDGQAGVAKTSELDDFKESKKKRDQSLKSATEQIERGRREVQHLKNRLAEKDKESTHQDEVIRSLHSTVSDQESAIFHLGIW